MAVAFRAASNSGNAASASSCASSVPAGAAVDDIAVAFLETWNAAVTSLVPPSGFTQKGTAGSNGCTFSSGDGQARNYVFWKRLTAADSGSYTFSWSGAKWSTLQVMLFSGCITTGDPFDATATPVAGTFGSVTSMSLTTTDAAGALLYTIYNDSSGTHTPPTGFTETADVDSASMAYKLATATGSITVSGASVSSSSSAGAWAGALLSDGGGGAPALVLSLAQPYTARRRAANF